MVGRLLFTLPPPQVRALSQEARRMGSHPALAKEVLAAQSPIQGSGQPTWL